MKILRAIKVIKKLDLDQKDKNKIIVLGILENILNLPKTFVWLIVSIPFFVFSFLSMIFNYIGELFDLIQTPFYEIGQKIKNSNDITLCKPALKTKYDLALKQFIDNKTTLKKYQIK